MTSKYGAFDNVLRDYHAGKLSFADTADIIGTKSKSAFYGAYHTWKKRQGLVGQPRAGTPRAKQTAKPTEKPQNSQQKKDKKPPQPVEKVLNMPTVIPWGTDGSLLVTLPGVGYRGKTLTILGYPAEVVIKREA